MSQRQARRAVKEAEALRLLVVEHKNGSRNTYEVLEPALWPTQLEAGAAPAAICETSVDAGAGQTPACETSVDAGAGQTPACETGPPRPARPRKEYTRKEEKNKRRARESNPEGGFDRFWAAWPPGHKVNRKKATAAWLRLKPDIGLTETILAALEAQKAGALWQKGIGIPHPTTWLNDERWLDEIPQPGPHIVPSSSGRDSPTGEGPITGNATRSGGVSYIFDNVGQCHRLCGRDDQIVTGGAIPEGLRARAEKEKQKAQKAMGKSPIVIDPVNMLATRFAAPIGRTERRRMS